MVQMLVVEVTDTGRGMDSVGLELCVKAFGQIRTGIDQEAGTGLGLPLSAAQAKGLGGSLELDSEGLGKGTTATLRLRVPTCPEHVESDEPEDPLHAVPERDADLHILFADDSKANCRMFGFAVKHVDSTLSTQIVEDGNKAVAAYKALVEAGQTVGLIILDYHMPGLNGDATAVQIRALGYTGYMALLSGNEFGSDRERKALRKTFDLLLVKGKTPALKDLLERYA